MSCTRGSDSEVATAAVSTGGSTTRSCSVVNTTGSATLELCPIAPVGGVITWVPAGTTTTSSSAAVSQKVTSARATDGGNGEMPIMFRKCT